MEKRKTCPNVVRRFVKYDKDPILLKKEVEEKSNFAKFNNQDHLLIDVPKEGLTLSCKLEDGRRVTFAFVPETNQTGTEYFGAAECVDVCLHDAPDLPRNDLRFAECPKQQWALFNGSGDTFRTKGDDKEACTLAALLLSTRFYTEGR